MVAPMKVAMLACLALVIWMRKEIRRSQEPEYISTVAIGCIMAKFRV